MRILAICSALDLRLPYSCTPAWWQLLKALAEEGDEITAIAYAGESIESPWWSVVDNPCQREGDLFAAARAIVRCLPAKAPSRDVTVQSEESMSDKLTRAVAQRWVMPRWRKALENTIKRRGQFDAVLVLTVPLNHLAGLPRYLRERFDLPIFYYDGDLPASLPRFQGFQSGFRIYQGADLSEYHAFIANSRGGAAELRTMGADRVHVLYYGADPQLFAPRALPQDIDVFFYGHGDEYRKDWIGAMLTDPSEALPEFRFAVRGSGFSLELKRAATLPYLSMSALREYCCRSKLNLVITRETHSSVDASSTSRPFELAALGATMVANPYQGLEEWFEPGREVIVVESKEEAIERYRWLLYHEGERRAIGERARQRLLAEHTYMHRARQLKQILQDAA